MGIFDDLEYPDNSNRAKRAAELLQDAGTMSYQSSLTKDEVSDLIKKANETIAKAYKDLVHVQQFSF